MQAVAHNSFQSDLLSLPGGSLVPHIYSQRQKVSMKETENKRQNSKQLGLWERQSQTN